MSAILGATLGAINAVQSDPLPEAPVSVGQNPHIAPWERNTDTVLTALESDTFNYGVAGIFGTLAIIQGGITGYTTVAVATGGACGVTSGALLQGVGLGIGKALAPLAPLVVGIGAGLFGLAASPLLSACLVAGAGGLVVGIGTALGQYGEEKGKIIEGSPNVYFNNRAVARAGDAIVCSDHPWTPPPVIAEGAETVFANNKPIARLGHRTSCDGNINSGSSNIVQTQKTGALVAEIKDSRNIFLRTVSKVVEVVIIAKGLQQSLKGIGNSLKNLSGVGEPVDIITGDFIQVWPVINIPGVLPLTLNRLYRSTETFTPGGYLGHKWADSWSQHLVVHEDSIDYLDEEGVLLSYHTPEEMIYAINLRQGRYILSGRRAGSLTLFDRQTQRLLTFNQLRGNQRYLSRIEDRKGNWIAFDYSHHDLTGVTHSDGYQLVIHAEQQRIYQIELIVDGQTQRLLTCDYHSQGELIDCHSFQFGRLFHDYNPQGYMTHWRDTDATQADISYNEKGQVTATRTAAGHFVDQFIYDDIARHNIYIDAEGGQSHYYYNEDHLVTTVVDPLGHITQTEWALTHKVAETDALGRTWRYEYNLFGELTVILYPDDTKATYTLDHYGQPVDITAPTAINGTIITMNADHCVGLTSRLTSVQNTATMSKAGCYVKHALRARRGVISTTIMVRLNRLFIRMVKPGVISLMCSAASGHKKMV